ncbi:MAG: D-2-hydroxyacid dehydrogenase [Bacteroidales bacterium]
MKVLVYIAAEPVWTIPTEQVVRLQQQFPQHRFVNALDDGQAREEIADADVVFSSLVTPALFAAARQLKWIQSPAAGVGRLLFPAVKDSDVILTNASGLHAVPIAEHVFGLAIALARKFQTAVRRQVEHRWAKDEIGHVSVLHGHRLGIIGLGAIGSAVAKLGMAFGMRVDAVRRHPDAGGPDGVEHVYGLDQLDTLLATSDFVVVCAPLTAETAGLIGERQLRLMKPTAFLINVARGKLIREAELVEALKKETIGGAGLDVFEHEPLDPASPLWDLPNVLVTPHTSGFFERYWEAASDLFADNLRRWDRGEPLRNVVDKKAGY